MCMFLLCLLPFTLTTLPWEQSLTDAGRRVGTKGLRKWKTSPHCTCLFKELLEVQEYNYTVSCIKGLFPHYLIVTRMFLSAAGIHSASIPASVSQTPSRVHLHLLCSKLAPHVAFPSSAAVPKPRTRFLTSLVSPPLSLVICTLIDSPEVASGQRTSYWHGHLALVTAQWTPSISTSPISSTHHRTSSLTAHFGWIPCCNFLSRGTSDFPLIPMMRNNQEA